MEDKKIQDKLEANRSAVENARDVFLKFVAPDGLKPEYDGMSAWEIVSKIISEWERGCKH